MVKPLLTLLVSTCSGDAVRRSKVTSMIFALLKGAGWTGGKKEQHSAMHNGFGGSNRKWLEVTSTVFVIGLLTGSVKRPW